MTAPNPLRDLSRRWWFPGLPGYRDDPEYATYCEFDLDSQPSIEGLTGRLDWLPRDLEPAKWSIVHDDDGQPSNVQSLVKLAELGLALEHVDSTLLTFLDRPELQGAIRSSTGCYLDLGDSVIEIGETGDTLLHILSDQQWCKHWYVYCSSGPRRGVVLAADHPYGFHNQDWFEHAVPTKLPETMASDFTVSADSFEQFLMRLWLENEIFFATTSGEDGFGNELVATYAARLRR